MKALRARARFRQDERIGIPRVTTRLSCSGYLDAAQALYDTELRGWAV